MLSKKFSLLIMIFFLLTGCVQKSTASPSNQAKAEEEESKPIETEIAVAGNESRSSSFQLQGDIKIVALGDSLTKGVGDRTKEGYVGLVSDELEKKEDISSVSTVNFAAMGHSTENLLKKLDEDQVKKELEDADLIFMTIGANDLMKVVRENIFELTVELFQEERLLYEQRLRDIMNKIRLTNEQAVIAFIGLYNPFAWKLAEFPEIDMIISEWNERTKQILLEDGRAVFVSIQDIFQEGEDKNLLYTDEFHPNENGYVLIAARVMETLENGTKKD
jgi:lysophospholipase L1-like esterase